MRSYVMSATEVKHNAAPLDGPYSKVYAITSHVVTGLDLQPYVEYRLEERDNAGAFVGYCAFGSQDFVRNALDRRLAGHN